MKTLLLLLTLLLPCSFFAQTFSQLQKIVAADRSENDEFGNAVAISGDFAIVGVMREDENAAGSETLFDAGSAYIFKRSGDSWSQEAKIVSADREANDFFGHAVDIHGDFCIVGAHQEGVPASSGAAYVFKRESDGDWVQVNKLEAPVRKANDYFGFSVAISETYAVVGAYYEDEDALDENEVLSAGSAYLFKRDEFDSWNFYQKIVADDRQIDDRFGRSVAISGEHIIVGAEYDDVTVGDETLFNSGSAYLFRLMETIWTQEAHLIASDFNLGDHFGWTVAVDGDYALVGAYGQDSDADEMDPSPDAGAVYFFERGSGLWPQVAKVVASDRADIDYYGFDVAISGDKALVGAYRQNFAGDGSPMFSDAGAAYVIERSEEGEWLETQKINHADRNTLDQFGYSVDIDSDDIIVGALTEDEDENADNPLPEAGSAYIFGSGSTGIFDKELKVSVYPNPANDFVTIELADGSPTQLHLQDATGRMVQSERINSNLNQLRLDRCAPGVYHLSILQSDSKKTLRLVVY